MPSSRIPFEENVRVSQGKGAKEGLSYHPPTHSERLALPSKLELRPPRRPGRTSRYPIDLETFARLKSTSVEVLVPREEKLRATLAPDRAQFLAETAAPSFAAPAATAPHLVSDFGAIPATGWFPFDCAAAVGPNHVVCSLNSSVSIFSRTGTPLAGQTLDAWFSSVISNATIFDPRLIFDLLNNRFILAAAATNDNNGSWFLLSVSQTPDPTGPWWNYALDATLDGTTPTNNWGDYPCLGQDADSIYLTANMFQVNGSFQYAKLRIIPKSSVYSGGVPTFHDVTGLQNSDGSTVFTLQPCNTLGPASAEYLVNSLFPTATVPNPASITLWSILNGATNPAITSQTIQTVPYGLPPQASQSGGVDPLDTGDTRALNAVYSNGSIWTAFNTQHDWDTGSNVAAIQWFEINSAGVLLQQSIYGSQGIHYFYPAVIPDSKSNAYLVFCRSSPSEFASLYFAGRAVTDPSGSMSGSVLLKSGTAPYVQKDSQGRNRWGDYLAVGLDPSGSTVWLNGGYAVGAIQWATHVAQVTI
jgi:hypothetical protein